MFPYQSRWQKDLRLFQARNCYTSTFCITHYKRTPPLRVGYERKHHHAPTETFRRVPGRMKCSNRIGIDNLAIGLLYFAQDRLDSALTSRCDFFDDVVVMEGTAHGNAMAALRHI